MREQRLVFGEVATDYDEFRADYPDALVEAVYAYLGRTPDRIVEVGAGTGKATAVFARHTAAAVITCVEPDPAMAEVLRARFDSDPSVTVWSGGFEDFPVPDGGVPLIICAQAWHWVRPEVRMVKAHQVLAPGGVLALFGHRYRFADAGMERRMRAAYTAHAPALLEHERGTPPGPDADWLTGELGGTPLFTDVTATRFVREVPYSTDRYLGLMSTFSSQRMLPDRQRADLFAAIAEVVDGNGGVMVQRVSTLLGMARRAQV